MVLPQTDSPRSWSRQVGGCSVPSCDRPKQKAGLCSAHYQRKRKYGDLRPDAPIRHKQTVWGALLCLVEECEMPSRNRGWCMQHYQRWRSYGDPLGTPEPRPPEGYRRGQSDGYVLVCVPGQHYLEHRLVWEAKRGALLSGQNIHHRNGDRADNRFSNLEVWDTSQPAGQRPPDKVEYAVLMLRRYAPEMLRSP